MTTWCPWRWCHCRRNRASWRRWRARWRSAKATERSSTTCDREAAEQPGEELLFGRVGRGPSHQRGAEQGWGERHDGAADRPEAPDGDEEGQDAPSAGQGAVEVERGHRSRAGRRGARRGAGIRRGVVGHGSTAGSGKGGATPPGPSGEAPGPFARLPAVDDGPPAAGLVHGGLRFGESPLLNRRHAVRT